jgi:hypothetical protein
VGSTGSKRELLSKPYSPNTSDNHR